MPRDDAGFDAAVLSAFRPRLLAHDAGTRRFDLVVIRCRERGGLKAGSTQRTDAMPVLAVTHNWTRVELVLLPLMHALETLACVAPERVVAPCPATRGDRDGVRLNDRPVPRQDAAPQALVQQAGADGQAVLRRVWVAAALYEWLVRKPACQA